MASVLIVAGGTGCAASRASVLAIAEIFPRPIFEAVVCVGVTRIAAKAARCASAMLRIRVVFPIPIFQGMVLFRGRTNVGITDAAIHFDGVLTVIIPQSALECKSATKPGLLF